MTGAIVGDESFFDKLRVGPGWKASFYKDECPPLSALIVNRGHFKGYITSRPALAAAKMLRSKLVERGIKVGGHAKLGRADPSSTVMATEQSPALRWLVRTMDRQSDNFYAETLTKLLGALEADEGSTSAGATVIRKELRSRDVPMRGVVISDGSGLSAYDRLTARAAAKLLRSALSDSQISNAFVDSLPTAGVNGTLVDRMTSGPAYRNVYAKTGTTDSASALSGFVRTRYVFAILHEREPDSLVVRPRGAGPLRAGPSRPVGALEQLRRAARRPPSGPSSASTRRGPPRRSAPSSSPRPSS